MSPDLAISRIHLPHDWTLASPPPLALYIHFPWCVRKCPYCDFNSHTVREPIPEQRYIDALITDLEQALPLIWGRRIHSIFMGGGTPSLFSPTAIDRLLCAVRSLTQLDPMAEITLETNPGTAESERFAGYRASGINRLSLGIQSLNNTHLTTLGRIHDAREAHQAIELAAQNFSNINLDIMYALPGQTLAQAQHDLHEVLRYQPHHLSCYHLTLEPNTPFFQHPPALPDDDLSADMQVMIETELAQAGYRHYETSAFSLPLHRAQHNLNYWQFGDYLGIGAGAHSKLSSHAHIQRQIRHPHPRAYMEHAEHGNAVMQEHAIEHDALGFEFMMNALRLTEGFPTSLFTERTGLPLITLQRALNTAEQRGLILHDAHHITPTLLGQRFLNDLLTLFLPSHDRPRPI